MVRLRRNGKLPTRSDVARLANTSPATVSYVVNNGPKKVSPETRDRVLRAIDELDYRPDPVARSFRGWDAQAIGMLVPSVASPYFADLAAEVERQASHLGKVVILGSTGFEQELEERALQNFVDRRVGAVLVMGPAHSIPKMANDQGGLMVMRLDRPDQVTSIGIAQRAATREAVEHLIGHGHDRIAAIFGPTSHSVFNIRYRGWRDATGYSPAETRRYVRRAAYGFQGGHDATLELFSRPGHPTALFVSNDTQAIGALAALHRLGLQVPTDVAVVSIDATAISSFLVPPLTSITQPIDLIAAAALEAVDGPAKRDGQSIVRIPHALQIRESCGCPPPARR